MAGKKPDDGKREKKVASFMPTLRDPRGGWKHFAALMYAASADLTGFWLLWQKRADILLLPAIFFSFHGRLVASYLVHEATHASIFVDPMANQRLGKLCLWLAGCPYVDFKQVHKMHMAHHRDRADAVEFDHRAFIGTRMPAWLRNLMIAMEWACIPAVETMMHFRTAFYPIFYKDCPSSRFWSSLVGTLSTIAFYFVLWHRGVLLPHLIAGALVLQGLAVADAFHHTYEAIMMKDYKPGPGKRTAQYEEENTYSNVISMQFPILNLLVLNFVYHNAHHKKPMVPWYALPNLHDTMYRNRCDGDSPQLLYFSDIFRAWFVHRTRRVLEEDYGVVHPPGTPGRANDFVGASGVSFLTV